MKIANFCKIFIFSFLNLLCYLLSIIFLTATYNIKDQVDYELDIYNTLQYIKSSAYCNYGFYLNHYSGIAALFSIGTVGLVFYTIVLIIFIKKYKIDKENDKNSLDNNNTNNANNGNNVIIIKNENIENNENNNIQYNNYQQNEFNKPNRVQLIIQSYNSNRELGDNQVDQPIPFIYENENDVLETDESAKCLMKTLLASFIICQILYVVELFILSGFHHKSETMKKLNDKSCKYSKFSGVYRDLLIVGYIFLFILIIFYIVLFIFYDKCGESGRKRLERLRFCKICDDCIIAGCKKCTEIFKTMTDEELKQFYDNEAKALKGTNEQKDYFINNLNKYKTDLNNFNTLISTVTTGNTFEEEMNKLHLFPIVIKKT